MSFSIKQLLLAFVYVAVAIIALVNAGKPYVAGGVQLLNFVVLASLAYGILFTTGAPRAFRIGFLAWVLGASVALNASPYPLTQALLGRVAPLVAPKATTTALNSYYPPVYSSPVPVQAYRTSGPTAPPNPGTITPAPVSSDATSPSYAPSVQPPAIAYPAVISLGSDYYQWWNGFTSIGLSLFAMLFGLIGGWVTVFAYRKRERMLQAVGSQATS